MPDRRPVVVIGGINMDIQGRSYAHFIPGDSNPGEANCVPGGVGRNIAENLVRLGIKVELIGVLGDDTLSAELESSCTALGIGLKHSLRIPSSPASQYLCLLDSGGKLVGAVASMENYSLLEPGLLAACIGLLDDAACIVVDTNIPQVSVEWLAARYGRAREGKAEIRPTRPFLVLDPVSKTKAERASACVGAFDLAKPNLAEALILAGMSSGSEGNGPEGRSASGDPNRVGAARMLGSALRAKGLGEVFISLGSEGLYFEGPGPDGASTSGIVRPPRRFPPGLDLVSVSGAGDAACAALVWSLLEGLSLRERAGLAIAAALLTSTSVHTVHPGMNPDILRRIAQGAEHESFS